MVLLVLLAVFGQDSALPLFQGF